MTPEQRAKLEKYNAKLAAKEKRQQALEEEIDRLSEKVIQSYTAADLAEIDARDKYKAHDETERYYEAIENTLAVSEKHLAEIIGCSWQTICNYRKKSILPQPLTTEQADNGTRRYYDLCEAVRKITDYKETMRAQRSASAQKQMRNTATGEYIKK